MQLHRANPHKVNFNYNPQDKTVLQDQTLQLNVEHDRVGPVTDKVKLRNFDVTIDWFGVDITPDHSFTLPPSPKGDYVFSPGTDAHSASAAFASAEHTVEVFDQKLQQLTGGSIKWAFDEPRLGIAPLAGKKIKQSFPNAFYTRIDSQIDPNIQTDGGNLFFFDYVGAQGPTSTADSGEVVSHETGHAILDALRPNWMQSFEFEVGAFHEAFGDMVAMLVSLENEAVVQKVVEQTGGDLSNPNVLALLGEEMGPAIGRKAVRNSLNNFKYVDPDTLPDHAPPEQLAREPHSFARVWTGAFYELLDAINDEYLQQGYPPAEALHRTSQEGWRLLIGQIDSSPQGALVNFRILAQALVTGDQKFNQGKRSALIKTIFQKRNILPAQASQPTFMGPLPSLSGETEDLEFTLGEQFGPELAGVKVKVTKDKNIFSSIDQGQDKKRIQASIEKEITRMAKTNSILIPKSAQRPTLSDFLKPDGSYYEAYVDPTTRELVKVPLKI